MSPKKLGNSRPVNIKLMDVSRLMAVYVLFRGKSTTVMN
jgi:hypothetical protein